MQLWNDYEGKTIAGVYTIGRLLRPEGRSAFFEITNGPEASSVMRITESLNDEEQMLERWRKVSELKHENLIAMRKYGETVFDGTPLTYAVIEASDAALADILAERPLTHEEAMQVGRSVVAALTLLHANGLVHRHIEAANVVAVGEVVKLRSDCASECLADPELTTAAECQELIDRDVHDLSLLLLRVLTLEKKLSPSTKLIAPFDKIVPNGISGSWGLEQISKTLNPSVLKPLVPESVTTSKPIVAGPQVPQAKLDFQTEPAPQVAEHVPTVSHGPIVLPRHHVEEPAERGFRWWIGCAAAVLVAFLLYFHYSGGKKTETAQAPAAPIVESSAPVASATTVPESVVQPVVKQEAPPAPSHMQAGWYVIAYTYNHEDQAWKKVSAIIKQHASLKPLVVSPNGRGPFMIAFGGAMSREEAEAVRSRARKAGMPRDTFIRNYPSQG
ncbi:protein kinase [Granulicella sibirica]|uniref:Wiskott-Aldrich syndrome protein interacting protein n=1 Tax=Granulicella sibirica TaxID=2479048 RepID=A0A4Q0SUW8_9BACT|nr:protein kinase [Granulicella sibirica]RXH54835.1 Wiskott-Aldrich syndrome protein interacting protein [Granulicella sibirica]